MGNGNEETTHDNHKLLRIASVSGATAMTTEAEKMPERIWTIKNGSSTYTIRHDDYHLKHCGGTEYVRADLAYPVTKEAAKIMLDDLDGKLTPRFRDGICKQVGIVVSPLTLKRIRTLLEAASK
jgi:hypothetical protein